MTITQQQITAAQQDADAFNTVPMFNRINFIEKLLAEDVNTLFNARMVRYLLDSLKEANGRGDAYKAECVKLRDQAKVVSLPVAKGKAVVKLSRLVVKQADALLEISDFAAVATCARNDNGDLDQEWEVLQNKHADVLAGVGYGDES